jgi:hypothetical protein
MNEQQGKRRKTKGIRISGYVLFDIIFFCCSSDFLMDYFRKIYNNNNNAAILSVFGSLILLFFQYYLHIITHEAGHLFFGFLTGYTFVSLNVKALNVIYDKGKIKFRIFRNAGAIAYTMMAPTLMKNGKYPYILYNMGGILMNFITALAALCIFLMFPAMPVFLRIFSYCYFPTGFFIAVLNGIPSEKLTNDAYKLKKIIKNPNFKRNLYLLSEIAYKQSNGMRLGEFPDEYFTLSEGADITDNINISIKVNEYYHYLDLFDFQRAGECLKTLESLQKNTSSETLNWTDMEKVYIYFVSNDDTSVADAASKIQINELKKLAKNNLYLKRIEYTYLAMLLNDKKAAEKCYREAQKLTLRYPYTAIAESQMMLIDYVKNKNTVNSEETWKIG